METDERWKHNPRAGLRRVNVVRYKSTENVEVLFYPSYLRWMGDMALQKELQFECGEEVAGDCTGIIGRFGCLVLHSTQNTLDLSPNLDKSIQYYKEDPEGMGKAA